MKRKVKTKNNFYFLVYKLTESIPYGKVATYGQIATLIGDRKLARAVGYALHQLPFNTKVPWHRVINSKGRISIRGDDIRAQIQRILLEKEGIWFSEDGRVDLNVFQHDFKTKLDKAIDN